jgi:HTH-type transcriptional regulator/antitoxin HigA
VKELLRRRWIKPTNNTDELEHEVLAFMEMDDLDDEPSCFAHAARKSTTYASISAGQCAWLCRARQLARFSKIEGTYCQQSLNVAMRRLHSALTSASSASEVPGILSDAGIRMVIVEQLPGTRIDGACFWLDDCPVVALSLRFDRIDYFWFTLLHELGHVSSHHQYIDVDVERDADSPDKPSSERQADRFAAAHLIPPERLEAFIARTRPRYSTRAVADFAESVGVHPGLVVGQLQHRREITRSAHRKQLAPIRQYIVDRVPTDGWTVGCSAGAESVTGS